MLRSLACATCVLLAACFSSSGALPPVRWFDPLPARAADATADDVPVRVLAGPQYGREFVVRTGPHEIAIDAEHQWVAEPAQIVGAVLARALPAPEKPGTVVEAALELFELDVTGEPRARVRVVFGRARPADTPPVIDVAVAAGDRSPVAFAAAMEKALVQVGERARAR